MDRRERLSHCPDTEQVVKAQILRVAATERAERGKEVVLLQGSQINGGERRKLEQGQGAFQ